MNIQNRLDQLRLRCEFLLIANEWKDALVCYDEMLQLSKDPFILTARAKVLEHLDRHAEAMENFESALQFVSHDELKTTELLKLILNIQQVQGGLLNALAKENIRKFAQNLSSNNNISTLPPPQNQAQVEVSSDATILEPRQNQAQVEVSSDATILEPRQNQAQVEEPSDATILEPRQIETAASHSKDSTYLFHPPQSSPPAPKPACKINTRCICTPPSAAGLPNINPASLAPASSHSNSPSQCITHCNTPPQSIAPLALPPAMQGFGGAEMGQSPQPISESNQCTERISSSHQPASDVATGHAANAQAKTRPHISPEPDSSQTLGGMGKTFGRYQILKKLGEGGMGAVYKIHDPELGRIAALKVLRTQENVSLDQVQRFMQEVKATARLQHPGIVTIYEFADSPQPYFTMEHLDGKTLGRCIQEEIYKPQKAARILKAIAEAIACAHNAGIIHRDLKPGNIIIVQNEMPKVLDFGLAKLEGEAGLSKTGDIMGTPTYMPPEQARGGTADARSDIYSLGAIGYEMITGKPVFQGENVFQILQKAMNVDPIRPKSIYASIDSDIETILMKCLEKAPNKRYQTAQELADDLGRYLENRPILAKPPTFANRSWKWLRRNKERCMAGTALFALVIWGVFYLISSWIAAQNLTKVINMLNDVSRWDLEEVSYQEDAYQVFNEAQQLSPGYFVFTRWGEFCIRYAQKHPEEREFFYLVAEDQFLKAIQDNKDDTAALYYLIFIYSNTGQADQMNEYNEKLMAAVERLGTTRNEFYYLAQASYTDSREEKIKYYEKAVTYNPYLFCAYSNLAKLYLEKNEYDIAEWYFEKSLEVSPTYQNALVGRTQLYVNWGKSVIEQRKKGAAANNPNLLSTEQVRECLARAKQSLADAQTVAKNEQSFRESWSDIRNQFRAAANYKSVAFKMVQPQEEKSDAATSHGIHATLPEKTSSEYDLTQLHGFLPLRADNNQPTPEAKKAAKPNQSASSRNTASSQDSSTHQQSFARGKGKLSWRQRLANKIAKVIPSAQPQPLPPPAPLASTQPPKSPTAPIRKPPDASGGHNSPGNRRGSQVGQTIPHQSIPHPTGTSSSEQTKEVKMEEMEEAEVSINQDQDESTSTDTTTVAQELPALTDSLDAEFAEFASIEANIQAIK